LFFRIVRHVPALARGCLLVKEFKANRVGFQTGRAFSGQEPKEVYFLTACNTEGAAGAGASLARSNDLGGKLIRA
jgi:hypothetical protein